MTRIITTEDFINKATHVHHGKYSYSKSVYVKSKLKVIITCPIHGDFKQTPDAHVHGKGCQLCARVSAAKNTRMPISVFINKARDKHGFRYNYDNVDDCLNSVKTEIKCNIHGIFKQSKDKHLQGRGCPECAKENYGCWSKSHYVRAANNRDCTLYIIKCYSNDEEFFKIGITMNSLKQRFACELHLPYNYIIIKEIKGKAEYIWDLEKRLHRKYYKSKYKPNLHFAGETECFSCGIKKDLHI